MLPTVQGDPAGMRVVDVIKRGMQLRSRLKRTLVSNPTMVSIHVKMALILAPGPCRPR